MERYSSYKDSGVQWLGEIPSHWEMQRWRFLLTENKDKNTGSKEKNQLQFRYGDIVRKANQDEDADILETISKYTVVAPNDIMINGLNLNYDFISQRVAQVKEKGVITSAYVSLRPTFLACSKYYTYFLKSMDFKKMFHGMGTGIRLTLSYNELKNQFIPCPSIEEQQAIASYLDEATSKIDAAIAQQQKMIDLLNERKQIIINNAVTKGLNPNVKMKDSGVDWIGEIPEGWEIYPLKRCCELVREKVQERANCRISLENIESWTGNYISTDSMYEGIGIKFNRGDILFGKLRPYLAKVFLATNSGEALGDIWVLRTNSKVISEFLQVLLLSKRIIDLIDSSTYGAKMPRADWGTNSKICIPIPPIEEQKSIVEYLSSMNNNINKQIGFCRDQITLLQERKQIIINEVVTGKVKVC